MKILFSKLFHYIENLWIGEDGKLSLKRVLAILFSVHALSNVSYAIHKWDAGKSLSDLAMLIGIELGFAGALIGITQFGSFLYRKLEKGGSE